MHTTSKPVNIYVYIPYHFQHPEVTTYNHLDHTCLALTCPSDYKSPRGPSDTLTPVIESSWEAAYWMGNDEPRKDVL